MSGDAEQMRAASDGVILIPMVRDDGSFDEIECKRLRPGDLADATQFIYKQRSKRHMDMAATTNMALETVRDMHARALSMIQCTTVSVFDVVCDGEGRVKLAQLTINRAGGKQWTFEEVKARVAHIDLDDFFWKLCELSGCHKLTGTKTKEEPPDPLGTAAPTPTETPSAETTGTGE